MARKNPGAASQHEQRKPEEANGKRTQRDKNSKGGPVIHPFQLR